MKPICEMISIDRIIDLKGSEKKEVLKELTEVMSSSPEVKSKDDFYMAVIKREDIMSTGIGCGVAIPHVSIDSVSDFVIALGRKREGIDFDAIDEKPVYIVVMIGASSSQRDSYIQVLAKVSRLFKDKSFRENILTAKGSEEMLQLIVEAS